MLTLPGTTGPVGEATRWARPRGPVRAHRLARPAGHLPQATFVPACEEEPEPAGFSLPPDFASPDGFASAEVLPSGDDPPSEEEAGGPAPFGLLEAPPGTEPLRLSVR